MLSISASFVAIFALIQFPMTVAVGLRRAQTGIHFMAGDDTTLLRRMRAHGNFTETVPITLLVMAAAELLGASPLLLIAGGSSLLIGRLVHYFMLTQQGWGNGRALGMLLTFAAIVLFSGFVLLRSTGIL